MTAPSSRSTSCRAARRGCTSASGTQGAPAARFFRTDDAAGAAVFTDMTTPQNINYCTGQCWYDNYVVSPPENPDVVYLGGSFSYGEQHGVSNGRAVLLSTDGGATWSDLTLDQGNDGWLHPDQHALVTVPGEPLQFIAGNDGGVVRSNGKYVDASAQCDTRGLSPASTAFCKSLLNRIPDQTKPLNKGLTTLQFQSLSFDPDASAEQPDGRNAGQRHVRVQGLERGLAADHLRRRRAVRLERCRQHAAVQLVLRAEPRRELPERRGDEVGDHLGQDREQPGGLQLLRSDHRGPEPGDGGLDLRGLAERLADPGLGWRS